MNLTGFYQSYLAAQKRDVSVSYGVRAVCGISTKNTKALYGKAQSSEYSEKIVSEAVLLGLGCLPLLDPAETYEPVVRSSRVMVKHLIGLSKQDLDQIAGTRFARDSVNE